VSFVRLGAEYPTHVQNQLLDLNMRPKADFDFETLVELYYRPVFAFAARLCGQLDRALELTQHTFCLALNRQEYFEDRDAVKGWLFTLAFSEFLKERRLQKENPRKFTSLKRS
jgi:DNA-directed RNA polymerase specialized sigma24 family protein